MSTLSSISSGLKLLFLNQTSINENSELNSFKNINLLGEICDS